MAETTKMAVSELSRRTGMTTAAINFYVREGLLPRPEKTSATRALYEESYVELIERIKDLKARGLPLRVIGRVLNEANPASVLGVASEPGTPDTNEPATAPRASRDMRPLELDAFAEEIGLSVEQVRRALDLGLIDPSSGGRNERSMRFVGRDVIAGKALARLVNNGIGFDLLARHTAEFEPLTRAESHFMAEHLALARNSSEDEPNQAIREAASGFARLRDYLRIRKFEQEYPDWGGKE
jgi:DNA-binding transcriptional MerR regulator